MTAGMLQWGPQLKQRYVTSPDVLLIPAIPPFGQVGKSELSAGEDVEVTLKGTGFLTMEPFMGFLLQVQQDKTESNIF